MFQVRPAGRHVVVWDAWALAMADGHGALLAEAPSPRLGRSSEGRRAPLRSSPMERPQSELIASVWRRTVPARRTIRNTRRP